MIERSKSQFGNNSSNQTNNSPYRSRNSNKRPQEQDPDEYSTAMPSPSKLYGTTVLDARSSNVAAFKSEPEDVYLDHSNFIRNKSSLKLINDYSPERTAKSSRAQNREHSKSQIEKQDRDINRDKEINNDQYEMNETQNSRAFLKRTGSNNTASFNKTGQTGSQEKEMRSTRQTVNTENSSKAYDDEELMKLNTLKTNEGREALLKQLDFAIDFDNFLSEEGNLLNDVQKVIQISELQMNILITDNQDLTNYHKQLQTQRELVEFMNIDLNKKIMTQIDKNSEINQKRIEAIKTYDDLRNLISNLKHQSKNNRKEMSKTHNNMINQDVGHKDNLIEKMKAIEDENQKFKMQMLEFSTKRQEKIATLRNLKLDEKKKYDNYVKQKEECIAKKESMQRNAKNLVDGMRIKFEKMDTHKKLMTQNKFQSGDISLHNDIASSGLNNDELDLLSEKND